MTPSLQSSYCSSQMGEISNAVLPTILEANNPRATPTLAASSASTGPTIKVLKLSNTNLNKIEQLNMGEHNWPTWSDMMMNLFLLNLCGGYILGTIPCPTDSTESASIWDVNNLCIITAMKTCCTCEESLLLCHAFNAKDTWNILQTQHKKFGPVAQILLIQEALGVQFKCSDRLATTSTQLRNIIDCIYAIGILQQGDFLLIFLMNALSVDSLGIHNHIADYINASTLTNPYTSAHAL